MAKKKLGISQIEINKKFASREEAFKYAKRLREHIRYVCKKNANIGWQAQAMIVVSNIAGSTSYTYYELNGQPGKPKKKRKSFNKEEIYTDWHIHILLVSKPSYAFREEIKRYVDKNWIKLKKMLEKDKFNYSELVQKKKVYKKNTNINIAEYMIDQNVDILFCNYNYTSEILIPNGYTLKDLYKAYMKSRTAYKYCRRYFDNWEQKLKIDDDYYKIRNYYFDITKKQDREESNKYIRKVQLGIIEDNYNNVQNISHRIIENNYNNVQNISHRIIENNSIF